MVSAKSANPKTAMLATTATAALSANRPTGASKTASAALRVSRHAMSLFAANHSASDTFSGTFYRRIARSALSSKPSSAPDRRA